jgi:hypothetical protein
MTRQGWAERKVAKAATCPDGVNVVYAPTATKLLLAEHRRAVRVVKQEIKWQAARIAEEQQAHNADGEAIHNYALLVAHDILAALQKGRT